MTTNIFKPILFSTEMVQAILAGRKTQTRRVIKTQPKKYDNVLPHLKPDWDGKKNYPLTLFYFDVEAGRNHINYEFQLPLCQPGDILWVRETHFVCDSEFIFKADYESDFYRNIKWRPSLFMPKEAARIFLKVTNVRVERLQDINAADSVAEGISDVKFNYHKSINPRVIEMTAQIMAFRDLWDSINDKKNPWESNPWVWVYEFERIEKPENFLS